MVKSMYSMLNDRGRKDAWFRKIWRLIVSLKVQIFLWIVLKEKSPTADDITKMGWIGNLIAHKEKSPTADNLAKKGWMGNLVICGFVWVFFEDGRPYLHRYLVAMTVKGTMEWLLGEDVGKVWERATCEGHSNEGATRLRMLAEHAGGLFGRKGVM